MTIRKQIRTSILLIILILGFIGTGYYFGTRGKTRVLLSSNTEPVLLEISDAMKRYGNRSPETTALLRTTTGGRTPEKAELVFVGLSDLQTTQILLDALSQNNLRASFFLTGEDVNADIGSLSLIASAGYTIGIIYTDTASNLDPASAQNAISNIVRASASIQSAVGVSPSQILTLIKPGDDLLAVAYACSMDTVILPDRIIDMEEVSSAELAQTLVRRLARKSILCVRLTRNEPDAAAGIAALFQALATTDLSATAKSMTDVSGPTAEPLQRIYTSERAVAFTFSGLGSKDELDGVLNALKAVNGLATFFVTEDELKDSTDEINGILMMGHELGISVQASRFANDTTLLENLLQTRETIKTDYGYTGELAIRPTIGKASEMLRKACGLGGFTLLSSMVNAVRIDDIRTTSATSIIDAVLPVADGVLQRGEIVHFQMNQYQKSNQILGDLVRLIATQRNIYPIKPVMAIAGNVDAVYQYPLPDSAILSDVKGKIYPGQLSGSEITAVSTRYIGVDWVATSSFLPGFSSTEIKRLDKTGIVPNKDNMVFLTFDDWGTDNTITQLLDVLKAHKAKATFFVRTQNVVYNPNLLRAIAAAGHTIGCHTNTHFALANDIGGGKRFAELTDNQVTGLKQDLVDSYDLLQSIVGDMVSGTHPSLSRLFRPPTLAVSKNGLAAVLDCGFTYSVSGSFSSQDYKASSAVKLADKLKKSTVSGAVIVMHMSDTSVYTAEALDIYLSEMERVQPDKPFQFRGLSEVLQ